MISNSQEIFHMIRERDTEELLMKLRGDLCVGVVNHMDLRVV